MLIDKSQEYIKKITEYFKITESGITNAYMLHYLFNEHFNDKEIRGIEIGVQDALLESYFFSNGGKVKYITGIDPKISLGITNIQTQYPDKFKFLNGKSDDVIEYLEPSYDFIFIDGDHTYEQVKRDITNYLPKVKENGLLIGHDYAKQVQGVVTAVNEVLGDRDVYLGADFVWWVYV